MVAPVISVRTHATPSEAWPGAVAFDDGDGGSVTKGSDSATLQFRVYNDYGGTANSATATNMRLTTVDASSGDGFAQQTEEPVAEHWLHVKLISDNGVSVTGTDQVVGSVEGTVTGDGLSKAIYHKETGHQSIAKDSYLAYEAFMRVPSDASDGAKSVALRLEYDYV